MLLVVAGVLCGAPAAIVAGGEHQRRVAAELLVLRGDLDRFADEAADGPRKKGLADRIGGLLSGLDLLLRLADEEMGREPRAEARATTVAALRRSFEAGELRAADGRLATLIGSFPLAARALTPAEPSPERLARGREIHEELCAGCHDNPDRTVERPAYNLFEEARGLSPPEFAARLMIGVRGDRITGIGNPLSDEQLASLIAFYRNRP